MNKSIIEAVSENIPKTSFPSTTKVFKFFWVNMSHTELAPDLKNYMWPLFSVFILYETLKQLN